MPAERQRPLRRLQTGLEFRRLPLLVADRNGDLYHTGHHLYPEYEAREAARFSGLTFAAFAALPHDERLRVLAYHSMHAIYEGHVNDAVIRHQQAQARKQQAEAKSQHRPRKNR